MLIFHNRAIVARIHGGINMATNMERVVGIAKDAIQQVTREGEGFSLEERKGFMAQLKGAADAATEALELEEKEAKEKEAKEGKEPKEGNKKEAKAA